LTDLGVYYSETGDYAQAEYHFVESMKLLNKENFMGNTVMNMIELGNVKFKAGKTDEAISMLQEALDEAEKIKIKARISQIHLLLSQIFQKTNELAKSLSHYQTYHRISEEVEKEEAAKKVKNLQLIFESEQTKKENIIIKKQKQEIEKKNTELQETIDELTRAKVSRRAKAITMVVAIVLIVTEDFLVDITINNLPVNDYLWSFLAKGAIILSLKPIENLIEHFLMDKLVKKKKLIRETV
ncbi:MAG: tetratricopeptide repeat protein, partial [Cytophagaceae bacterium]